MEHIELHANHKRSISASIQVVEKLVMEIETEFNFPTTGSMYQIINDFESKDQVEESKQRITMIRNHVSYLKQKYGLNPMISGLRWNIEVRKSRIWEILSDTNSKRLKGYGEFPDEYKNEFDNDIKTLKDLAEKI